jgi:hypothetical protein
MLKYMIGFSLCLTLTSCSSTRITYEIGEEIKSGTVTEAAPKEVKRGRGLIGNYGDTYSLWDALFAEPSTKL